MRISEDQSGRTRTPGTSWMAFIAVIVTLLLAMAVFDDAGEVERETAKESEAKTLARLFRAETEVSRRVERARAKERRNYTRQVRDEREGASEK